nr:polyprotein [Hunnivirus sp.]
MKFEGPGQSKQESGNTNNSGNHGVINYNFYNQQWQNSVDLEHAMEQNATAYGGTGGGDSSHTNNRHENLLMSGLQAATAILPLLADGMTEDFENSDRVSKVQAGASTLVTQHHVGCLTYPKPSTKLAITSAADQPTTAGPSIDRFITIPVGEWTSANPVYKGWYLPLPFVALQRNTPFAALGRRHFLLNCGWHVQVQVNSTRFHGGALLVAMVPQFVLDNQNSLNAGEFSGQTDVSLFNLQSMFVYPHQILNPRTNSSAEVMVPYANSTPGCDPKEQAPWTLVIMVISPLSYSAGATTSLEIVASVRPTDAEFHGIRQTNAEFQGLPKFKNESASFSFSSTQPHSAEPDYGAMIRSSPAYLPAKITDLLQISQIPTLTAVRAVSFQQTIPTSALMTLNVSLSATDLLNTSLETVSRGFAQYRGSILIRMLFTGNQMQNVRFVAAYTPPGADPPTTLEEAMDGIYTIYDTGLNASADFIIPFISTTDFRFCNTDSLSDTGSAGYFTIWQLTNLAVPPGSPATAELLVFAATGADFEWRCATTPYLILQGEDTQVTPAETGATPEATAENSNENAVAIPYNPPRLSHSAVRFWFDRFFLADQLVINNKGAAGSTRYVISWQQITTQIPEIRWFTHATYIRFELEIALKTWNSEDADVEMVYYPSGSFIPSGTTTWGSVAPTNMRRVGACPRWCWNTVKTPVFTTRIPYTAPSSVIANTYTGWNQWNHTTGSFGVTPGLNTLGALQITQNITGTSAGTVRFYVSVRFVDIELYCPRPGMRLQPPAQKSSGATNFSLLQLAGDVELNPGPASFSKFAEKFMSPDMAYLFKKFDWLGGQLRKIEEYCDFTKIFDEKNKMYWFKKILKFLGYAVILLKAKKDPTIAAAVAFIVGSDWLSKLCCKISTWLQQKCRTPPPPLPSADDGEQPKADDGKDGKAWYQFFLRKMREPENAVNVAEVWNKITADSEIELPPHEKDDNWKDQFCGVFGKGISVNSGDILTGDEDVPLLGSAIDTYPEAKNPFTDSFSAKCEQKFKTFFKLEGPLQEINSALVLCRNAHWLGQQIQKILDWLGIWKKQEEEASEEYFVQKMRDYPRMMKQYEQVKMSTRNPKWTECQKYFDEMRQLVIGHDPKLVTLFPNMVKQEHENSRQEPILIVLRGKPGQGKSVAAAMLAQMFAHALTGKPDYYSYNSSTNFFDGYQQQPVVVIDDLGQNPAAADFSVFCQMISTTPFHPNMADLKDKGIKFDSQIIIATTNLPSFRPVTISDPQALERRINFDLTVEAGMAFKTASGTLDLEKALQPNHCSSSLPCVKTGYNIFTSACLKFVDNRKVERSMEELYDSVMCAHNRRANLADKLKTIFSFEGPRKAPVKKEVENWCDLHPSKDFRDDPTLNFIRQHFDDPIFTSYVKRFYDADPKGPNPEARRQRLSEACTWISVIVGVLTLFLMIFSIGVLIWELVTAYQGPYSGNAVVRDKKKQNGLKMIDIASFQGPANFDLEKSVLKKNCVQISMRREDGSEFTTGGIAIKNRIVVVNYHLWEEATHVQFDGEWILRQSIPAVRPVANGMPTELVFMNWNRTPGRQYRDIVEHFPRNNQLKLSPAAKITGLVTHMDPSFMFTAESLGTAAHCRTWESAVPMVLRYKAQTAPGFCGSVMIVDNGVWKKVFGIHCAGAHGIGMAAIITQEMVNTVLGLGEFQGRIHSVKEHPFIYTPRKTQLYPTVACDENTTVEPAALSMNDKRLVEPQNFKKVIMAKHVGDRTDGPLAMLRMARIYARIVRAKCGQVCDRLSLREAVFGTDNLDPMDMTRSPGWPYIGNKRRPELLKDLGNEIWMDPVLRAELMLMMEGDFSHHKFVTFLKDELRDKEKVRQGKTRVIDIASFGHAIMGRVLFGRLAATMHANNGVELGSAVGTNPDIDWTRYAVEFKFPHFVDVDYSGFDATHSTFSFLCLKTFLKELGFDQIALNYVDSLCNSTHIWDDEEFQITGGLPSGCSMTSIFNTIINNIVVRALVAEVTDGEFQMLAYGDDLVLCSEKKFDVEKYKEIVEEVTNYKITPASKSGTFEWTDLAGVVFLKRYFYRDGLIVRPVMTRKNLHNILSYARAGTVQEKIDSVARLVQHRGEQEYNELMAPFVDCGYVVPSFDDLELEFFSLFFG